MSFISKIKQMSNLKKFLLLGGIVVMALVLALYVQKPEELTPPSVQPKELKLSDFPEVFEDSTLIVIGDGASEIELQAAKEIADYLEKETGNNPLIKRYSEVSDEDRKNNLIVIGTPYSNPMLKEIYTITDVLEVNETFPGQGRGVLEILRNPWDKNKATLLVEGDNYQNINNIMCWILSYGKLLENSKIGQIIKEFLKDKIEEKNAIVPQKLDVTIFFLHYPNKTVFSNLKGIDITDKVKRAPAKYPIKSPYWIADANVSICELINLSKNPYIDKIDMFVWIDKKVSSLVTEQVFYRKLNDTVKVYLHFFNKPNNIELSKLKALGTKIDEDSWIPHSYDEGGSYSAEIPVNKVFEVAKFDFVRRISPVDAPTDLPVEPFPEISRTINVDAVPLTPTIIKIPVDYETAERILKGDIQVRVSDGLEILNISKNPPEIVLSHTPRAEGEYHFYISIDGEVIEIVITSKGVPKGMIPEE